MAQGGFHFDRERFCCLICLDLLKDPMTIPCGHNYCMSCIRGFWNEEDQRRIYSCPQCGQTFRPRPVLVKNTMLSVLVEELNKTRVESATAAAPDDQFYAGPEDVACDVCTGRKLKAEKSCLECKASYCHRHLQPHYDADSLRKHTLVEPSEELQERICPHHGEVMKMFCHTDQQCMCYLCCVNEHRGHDTVSAAAERTERQKELEVRRQKIQERIQDKEKEVMVLQQEAEAISQSVDQAVKKSEKIFTELIRLMQERMSGVKQQIRSHQETDLSRINDFQEKLEQEIAELKRKDTELEKLSVHQDDTHFLQNYPHLQKLCEPSEVLSIKIHSLWYIDEILETVSAVGDRLQHILSEEWKKTTPAVNQMDVLLSESHSGPKTRAEFLEYSCEITLDPNTANTRLALSEGNRRVKLMREQQDYSHHPERFSDWTQVLSRETLTGRCYWEVKWSGWGFYVAVSYRNIRREGSSDECRFGLSNKSWALHCNKSNYEFWCNNVSIPGSDPPSSRIGVYLDHRAGILSFYSVSETMSLLHRIQTTFTQPLYAGFWLYSVGDFAELCDLKQIEAV
uniref:Uncharacterized protein n=1 Tax=Sphaeramia orbicularis TaxID=375764 RepID=A0A673B129_9TELE